MKNLIVILILVIIAGLFAGVFTVNANEVAIVSNKFDKHLEKKYGRGIHFALPLFTQIDYVYVGPRRGVVSVVINTQDKQLVNVEALVEWIVVEPMKYDELIRKYDSHEDLNREFITAVSGLINKSLATKSISAINLQKDILDKAAMLGNYGIINNIQIVNVSYNLLQSQESMVAQSAKAPVLVNNQEKIEQLAIESAYYQAQTIKTQTEIEQAKMYDQIKDTNPEFYRYFRLLNVYKNSAKAKSDVPDFSKLYQYGN